MSAEIYLIAPADADPDACPAQLRLVLAGAPVAAILMPLGERSATAYAEVIAAVRPLAHGADAALLVEGDPASVRALGADGLHVPGGERDLRTALGALKPDFIVGSQIDGSRHDAMAKGELGADYIIFGPLSGAIDPVQRELARWWAETMEIPSVLSDPQAEPATLRTEGCEFLAVGDSVWGAPDPRAAIAAIARELGLLP